eukprot:545230-Amphidinium_carterae.1
MRRKSEEKVEEEEIKPQKKSSASTSNKPQFLRRSLKLRLPSNFTQNQRRRARCLSTRLSALGQRKTK